MKSLSIIAVSVSVFLLAAAYIGHQIGQRLAALIPAAF